MLETQYSLLLNRVRSTHDFEAVKVAHSDFVNTLQSQLFFSLEPVSRVLLNAVCYFIIIYVQNHRIKLPLARAYSAIFIFDDTN